MEGSRPAAGSGTSTAEGGTVQHLNSGGGGGALLGAAGPSSWAMRTGPSSSGSVDRKGSSGSVRRGSVTRRDLLCSGQDVLNMLTAEMMREAQQHPPHRVRAVEPRLALAPRYNVSARSEEETEWEVTEEGAAVVRMTGGEAGRSAVAGIAGQRPIPLGTATTAATRQPLALTGPDGGGGDPAAVKPATARQLLLQQSRAPRDPVAPPRTRLNKWVRVVTKAQKTFCNQTQPLIPALP